MNDDRQRRADSSEPGSDAARDCPDQPVQDRRVQRSEEDQAFVPVLVPAAGKLSYRSGASHEP